MYIKRCIVCREALSDGIIINGNFICSCCESKIVNSDANDDFYDYYVDSIKKAMSDVDFKNMNV